MESPELRHNRYRQAPPAGIQAHEIVHATLQDNSSTKVVPKRVQHYNSKVRNGDLNDSILDALFTELCYEYQARINSKVRCMPKNLDSFFRGIIEILLNNVGNLDEKTVNLLLDILVLEMVLYGVNDETKLIASTVAGNDETVLKIISSLIDALYLNSYIHEGNGGNQSGLIQITEPLRKVLKPAPYANSKYCALVSATIHKLVITFSTHDVMYFLWSLILAAEHCDGKDKQLKMVTIAFDSMLSVENDINVVYICRDEFWRLICYGLMSDEEEQQKQALYIMKKTLDYVEKEGITVKKGSLMPFVGCQRDDGQLPVQEIKDQFLLMIESLVDNPACQAHPAETLECLYNCLILGSRVHRTCGNCFDITFLHCIFKRILTHKSIDIIREGLENIILMDTWLIDNELLMMMVEALNNKSLYSPGSEVLLPDIVQHLGQILYYSEENKDALMNRFICTAATLDWDPIPFFYLIETLAVAASQSNDHLKINIWTLKEYKAVVKMIDKHIKCQTQPLQEVIANNMSKIVSRCAGAEIGLDSIALILFALGHSFDYDSSDNDHLPTDVHGLCRLNYSNNPKIWAALVDYLKEKVSDEDALAYVRRCCTEFSGSTAGASDLEYFAVMICLLAKGGKDFSPSSAFGEPLRRVFTVVRDRHARSHADTRVVIKIMELFTCLKRHAFDESAIQALMITCSSLIPLISSWQESFWQIIMNSLDSSRTPKTFAEAKQYIACFEAISPKSCEENYNFPPEFLQFFQTAWKIIGESAGEVDVHYWYALHIVGVCNRYEICCDYTTEQINIFWTAFMDTRPLKLVRAEDCSRESVKIISECCGIISQLIVNNVHRRIDSMNFNTVLSKFSNLLENGKEYVILQVIELHGLSRDVEESTYCSDLESALIDLSWKVISRDCEKSNLFWTCLRRLIRMMINSVFFGSPLTSTTALNHLETMLHSGITRYAKMILVSEIHRALVHTSGYRQSCLTEIFHLWLIPLACFIEDNKDKVEANLYNLYRESLEGRSCREKYVDVCHRVCCISSILHAMSKPSFRHSIVTILISMLKGFEGRKYIGDSPVQRQKHRVLQLLLLSHPHWDQATVKLVYDSICYFIVRETDQPSVRVMQEWLLALIYIKNPNMREQVWDLLEDGKDKRPESIASIAAVIYNVSQHLSGEDKRSFNDKAIEKLLPYCQNESSMAQRVTVFKFVQKIHEEAFHDNMPCDEVKKNSAMPSRDFLLTSFDPIENFDLQTIFYDLPRVLGMPIDEYIHPSIFKEYEDIARNPNITVENSKCKLSSISTPTQLTKESADDTANSLSKSADHTTNMMIDKKLGTATLRSTALADDTGLIVVASLIDRVPHLGGLARTAETFCARELVLGNLTCTQDREFQMSSLTSEKRVTLSEVKSEKLQDYLVEKISSGWSIVGAEHTTSSVKIQSMIFNRKTVLLLGNEKNGIPANLIPLLDVCVEIPHQAGVVRSLNAHVTGAICMWHYAKQYIF